MYAPVLECPDRLHVNPREDLRLLPNVLPTVCHWKSLHFALCAYEVCTALWSVKRWWFDSWRRALLQECSRCGRCRPQWQLRPCRVCQHSFCYFHDLTEARRLRALRGRTLTSVVETDNSDAQSEGELSTDSDAKLVTCFYDDYDRCCSDCD